MGRSAATRRGFLRHGGVAGTGKELALAVPALGATPAVRRQKRKWVGEQLQRLEEMDLVRRTARAGVRPLTVLRDDGSGRPYDDPGRSQGAYATVLGTVIASGALRSWGTAGLAAYLACMVGERHDPSSRETAGEAGTKQWFRPLAWFANKNRRFGSADRPGIPFSVPTLERGMSKLAEQGLMVREPIKIDPHTGQYLRANRTLYTNRFDRLS